MKRDELIQQVKEKYAGIAYSENQHYFSQTAEGVTFDNVKSADEIINKVAADKSILSDWK